MKALLIVLITCLINTQASLVGTVRCEICSTSTCPGGRCLVIRINDKTFTKCQSCVGFKPFNTTFGTCGDDLYGKSCSTGVCVQPAIRGCATSYFGENQCDTSKWKQISCGACTSPGCSKCAIYRGSNVVSFEECLGQQCSNIKYQHLPMLLKLRL